MTVREAAHLNLQSGIPELQRLAHFELSVIGVIDRPTENRPAVAFAAKKYRHSSQSDIAVLARFALTCLDDERATEPKAGPSNAELTARRTLGAFERILAELRTCQRGIDLLVKAHASSAPTSSQFRPGDWIKPTDWTARRLSRYEPEHVARVASAALSVTAGIVRAISSALANAGGPKTRLRIHAGRNAYSSYRAEIGAPSSERLSCRGYPVVEDPTVPTNVVYVVCADA